METSGKVYVNCKLLGALLCCFSIRGYTFRGATVAFLLLLSRSATCLKLSNSTPCHTVLIPDLLYEALWWYCFLYSLVVLSTKGPYGELKKSKTSKTAPKNTVETVWHIPTQVRQPLSWNAILLRPGLCPSTHIVPSSRQITFPWILSEAAWDSGECMGDRVRMPRLTPWLCDLLLCDFLGVI